MDVRIKVCGITRPKDATAAVEAGVDALGLMFYEGSPRRVTLPEAAELTKAMPERIARVGVFVNAEESFIRQAIDLCGLDTLQFHGNESPAFCARFRSLKIWKAFRISGPEVLGLLADYPTDAWLLDAAVSGQLGGTGERFDWGLALQAKALGRPIILAGGLTPENVREAVIRVRPFGVDVSSGVESAPGRKDAGKIRAFVEALKGED